MQRQLAAEEASEGLEMTDSALSRVQRAHADAHAVHRLDMETSGVLLVALDEAGAQEELYLGNDDDWLYGLHAMKPERGSA